MTADSIRLWKTLWRCSVPLKILNFGWWLIREVVPCLQLLRKRRVNVEIMCPKCHASEESLLHLFVQCSFARSVWMLTSVGWQFPRVSSWRAWLETVFQCSSLKAADEILMILWALWSARNKRVWNFQFVNPSSVVQMAGRVLNEWSNHRAKPPRLGVGNPANRAWSRPPTGFLKINLDASVFSGGTVAGVGLVCQNSFGEFIAAKTMLLHGQFNALHAEALSVREALSWIKAKAWSSIIVESDALMVVNAINSSTVTDDSSFGLVISDCKLLINEIDNVECRFVYRSANVVAHLLATGLHSLSGLGV
ncbi:uncharacterized protein LOC105646438 [Jatropha curcas]|uniref:uncharacterized protein LOC105646438 n=1 Tax=Jatropha curcas TaxID=180498 RepID=UPI0005FB31B0|nr:uncharacterized protein LOC105646438 [Jatropha curcas]